jgi:hypothetical protein
MMPIDVRAAQESLFEKMSALELIDANKEARDGENQEARGSENQEARGGERANGVEEEYDPLRPQTPERERNPFEGMKVLSPLRRKTFTKVANGSNLEYEVRQLRRLSSYELVRENNIARNHETLVSLGLDKSFDEMMAIKRKAGAKQDGKRATKRTRKRDEEEYDKDSSTDEDQQEMEDGDEDAPSAAHAPCTQRAKLAVISLAPKEWVKKAETTLERAAFGPRWGELVSQWYLREQQNGFVCPVSIFSACTGVVSS